MSKPTYKLYADSSFWEGMARLFDFQGALSQYNVSASGAEADNKALHSDWMKVGDDLRTAVRQFEEEHQKHLSG